jgi:membrane protein YqaA with SNARE-associated domain
MLRRCYNWLMEYASHPRAPWMLYGVSFAESSVFPLPPDPLFIAMCVNHPEKAWRWAFGCVMSSVLGGILGYFIGAFLYKTLGAWIFDMYGLHDAASHFQVQFQKWGFWIVALKGLTPIPFKVVTIMSGAASMSIPVFLGASLLARGFRFYTLALFLVYFGPHVKSYLDRHLGVITAVGALALMGGFFLVKYIG